jgi:hypothetical protein
MTSRKLTSGVTLFLCPVSVFGLLAAGVAAGQSTKPMAPNAQKSSKPGHPAFTCPDPLAAEACKSFEELYKAGDKGLTLASRWETGYVCFRQNEDQFFVLTLNKPLFPLHWDKETKSPIPDDDATAYGFGSVNAYSNGVNDFSIMPIFEFAGRWTPAGPTLSATRINGEDNPDPTHNGISVDPEQINATWRFKNRFDKDVDYHLVIQRSTGRFTETYTEPPSHVAFAEQHGRCSPLPSPRSEVTPSHH